MLNFSLNRVNPLRMTDNGIEAAFQFNVAGVSELVGTRRAEMVGDEGFESPRKTHSHAQGLRF